MKESLYARTLFMYGPVYTVQSVGDKPTHALDLRTEPLKILTVLVSASVSVSVVVSVSVLFLVSVSVSVSVSVTVLVSV